MIPEQVPAALDEPATAAQVNLLEYQQLKAEQIDRISRRDNLLTPRWPPTAPPGGPR